MRLLVALGGAALWLLTMLVETGGDAFAALWANVVYLAVLFAIASLTRTMPLRWLVALFFSGAAMMSVTWVVAEIFETVTGDATSPMRDVFIPTVEEVLKLVPVLGLLWWSRRAGTWALGATDVLLMGAASGAGFAVVEDAFLRDIFGWADSIAWLPPAEDTANRVIVGHSWWTLVAAATIGLALLIRHRHLLALVVAPIGLVLSTLDHIANNYAAHQLNDLADTLTSTQFDGRLTLYAGAALVVGVVVADAFVLRLPLPGDVTVPDSPPSASALDRWRFLLDSRAWRFATYQAGRAQGEGAKQAGELAAAYELSLKALSRS